jgi:hypothetical protein
MAPQVTAAAVATKFYRSLSGDRAGPRCDNPLCRRKRTATAVAEQFCREVPSNVFSCLALLPSVQYGVCREIVDIALPSDHRGTHSQEKR